MIRPLNGDLQKFFDRVLMNQKALQDLILYYLDGQLAPEQVQQLGRVLRHNRVARQQYWSLATIHAGLCENYRRLQGANEVELDQNQDRVFWSAIAELLECEQQVEPDLQELDEKDLSSNANHIAQESVVRRMDDVPVPEQALPDRRPQKIFEIAGIQIVRRAHRHPRRFGIKRLAWAAAIMLAATTVVLLMQKPTHVERVASAPMVATLVDTVAAQWLRGIDGDESVELEHGATFEAGTVLHLSRGLAELETQNGTSFVLEAPATFTIQAEDRMSLQAGRLVARAGNNAESFTVVTPSARITDLGTEFGVEVESEQSGVHVFEGRVRLEQENEQGQTQRLELSANEGALATQGGFRRHALESHFDEIRSLPYVRLVRDAEPVLYWRPGIDGSRAILSEGERLASQATVQGQPVLRETRERVGGRWQAMFFDGQDDGVELPPIDSTLLDDGFTVEVWIKPERIGENDRSPRFLSSIDGDRQDLFSLGLVPPRWRTDVGAYSLLLTWWAQADYSYEEGYALEPGIWSHVVVTVDATGIPLFYLNGKRLDAARLTATERFLIDMVNDTAAVQFVIGRSGTNEYEGSGNWNGGISDVVIYPHVLHVDEIEDRLRTSEFREF